MKAKVGAGSPEEYIAGLEEPRRSELQTLHDLIRSTVPNLEPVMVSGMIGYGMTKYKYKSGREGEWPLIGLASNKSYISLYACSTDEEGYIADRYRDRLPKADIGKSCIRFKRVSDLDLEVVKELLSAAERMGFMSPS